MKGDCLHFGLAAEKANALNSNPCVLLLAGDDVGVGKKAGLVGRRGLAGQLVGMTRTSSEVTQVLT